MYSLTANEMNGCETTEAVMPDTEELLTESLIYKNDHSALTSNTHMTPLGQDMPLPTYNCCLFDSNINVSDIQIPIVGYEVMEERARFTVYKLRIENKISGNFWYVFRRYTDFVRLCNKLRNMYPQIMQHLPRKRWLKNNFDPIFLEERINGLQTLINTIIHLPDIFGLQEIQDFFCLNESPGYSETNDESRAMFETMEEIINNLKRQLHEKESVIDSLQTNLHSQIVENDNLKKLFRNSTMDCCNCRKESEHLNRLMK